MTSLLLAVLSIIPQPKEVRESFGLVPVDAPVLVEHVEGIAAEGYSLEVDQSGKITIRCSCRAGEFYARQTLRQALGCDGYQCMAVNDEPAFRWRGMLLDECRHFFGKDVVKKVLDVMAQYKLNVLHWHLTDDQGWRLDIPGYPELVRFGAVRRASPRHGAGIRWIDKASETYTMDVEGQRYGPYF